MSLTPQERQRIEDEEHNRYHEEAYRAEVRRRLTNDPPERPKRFVHAFTAAMITLIGLSAGLSQTHMGAGPAVFIALIVAAVVGKKVL